MVHLKDERTGWSTENKMCGIWKDQRGQTEGPRRVKGDPVKWARALGERTR